MPTPPPAAAATTASISLEVDKATAQSGAQLNFTAGFEVSGGTLQNTQVKLFFPASDYRHVFPTGGGRGTTTTHTAAGTTLTYFLGRLTDGTIGTVSAQAASLAYLPDDTVVSATAEISGQGLPAQPAPSAAATTLHSAAQPQLVKTVDQVVQANGPGSHSAEAGYQVSYLVRAASNCDGFGTDRGCLPFQGTLTETLPPSSYFVSITNPDEYVDRANGVPDGPGFTFPRATRSAPTCRPPRRWARVPAGPSPSPSTSTRSTPGSWTTAATSRTTRSTTTTCPPRRARSSATPAGPPSSTRRSSG